MSRTIDNIGIVIIVFEVLSFLVLPLPIELGLLAISKVAPSFASMNNLVIGAFLTACGWFFLAVMIDLDFGRWKALTLYALGALGLSLLLYYLALHGF